MLLKIEKFFDKFSTVVGYCCGILMVAMLLNVFYDAIMRYLFNTNSIALQEMEWHIFSVVFLFGISYCLQEDGHVRVDVIYDRLGHRAGAIINIVGTLLFILPFCWLIIGGSFDFVREAYDMQEISGDPGGLTHRYLIKSAIPVSFMFLIFSACGFLVKNINQLRKKD
jgi:TRAP-type mannitol/chloroaromatic compound transport system permease small subunit